MHLSVHVISFAHDRHPLTPVNFDFLLQETVDSHESLLFILKPLVLLHDLENILLERTYFHLFVVETFGHIF